MSRSQTIIAVIAVVGFILVTAGFFLMMFMPVQIAAGEHGKTLMGMLGMIVGAWITNFGLVMNWHFSSSKGSSDKTVMLQKQNLGSGG